jgi:3-methyladenine DNA glycosylase AlkD
VTAKELYKEFHEFCVANQDPAIVQKYSRYFKEGFPGYGLPKGYFEEKMKELAARPGMELAVVRKAAPLLLKTGKYEETSAVIALSLKFHKQFDGSMIEAVEEWFRLGISNWAHTDFLCGDLMTLLFKKKLIDYRRLGMWRTSGNKFQRRAVPVSLIKQLKVVTDFRPFFDFIDPMMTDPEREVHQGLGWFLREAWKKQPGPTESFLMKWKDTAPRLIFQYATEKMTADQKARFRRNK